MKHGMILLILDDTPKVQGLRPESNQPLKFKLLKKVEQYFLRHMGL